MWTQCNTTSPSAKLFLAWNTACYHANTFCEKNLNFLKRLFHVTRAWVVNIFNLNQKHLSAFLFRSGILKKVMGFPCKIHLPVLYIQLSSFVQLSSYCRSFQLTRTKQLLLHSFSFVTIQCCIFCIHFTFRFVFQN